VAEFKVPELGENVAGGDVTSVLVKVGDTIAREQSVVELETDKATIEVPSSVAGRVTDIKVKPGDKVNVGDVLLIVEDGAGEAAEPAEADAKGQAADPKSQTPDPKSQSAHPKEESPEPEVDNEEPEAGSPTPTAQSPKPKEKVVSMPARQAPEPSKRSRAEAAQVTPNSQSPTPDSQSPTPKAQSPTPKSQSPGPKAESPKPKSDHVAAPAAPGVRRLAREVGVDIDEVQGSGPQGRISEEDVKEHARRILSSVGTSRGGGERAASPLPDFERWGEIERQPMSNIRRTTASRLGHA
jgi:pyruvate dehydrogenase E2 component (dihydrolipoamide acetyltransferase)